MDAPSLKVTSLGRRGRSRPAGGTFLGLPEGAEGGWRSQGHTRISIHSPIAAACSEPPGIRHREPITACGQGGRRTLVGECAAGQASFSHAPRRDLRVAGLARACGRLKAPPHDRVNTCVLCRDSMATPAATPPTGQPAQPPVDTQQTSAGTVRRGRRARTHLCLQRHSRGAAASACCGR